MSENSPEKLVVPLLDLKAQLEPLRDEILAAIQRVVDSQHFILGPEVEALERAISEHCGCEHAIGVSSGTDALLVALMAAEIKAGDEVITSPFSFFSTAGSIARLGAKPVFVDIDRQTFNIDVSQVEAALSPRTKAIIPVHLFGQMADMDPIQEVADSRRIPVIEDAAQSLGARYQGRCAGSIGTAGCFSFFPTKNLGAYGDGGMVVTGDAEFADRVRMLRNHGFRPKYHAKLLGGNFRLDAIQAAVLHVKLKYLENWNEMRRAHARTYEQLFAEKGLSQSVTSSGPVTLPHEFDGRRHVFHQYVIRVAAVHREPLRDWLAEQSIATEVYYPLPLHLQECFANLGYRAGQFPLTEQAADEVIALPIFAELTSRQQTHVVDSIAAYFGQIC